MFFVVVKISFKIRKYLQNLKMRLADPIFTVLYKKKIIKQKKSKN